MDYNCTVASACGQTRGNYAATGGQPPVIHRITTMSFPACGRWWIAVGTAIRALRWANDGLCTIHSPYYYYYPYRRTVVRGGAL